MKLLFVKNDAMIHTNLLLVKIISLATTRKIAIIFAAILVTGRNLFLQLI